MNIEITAATTRLMRDLPWPRIPSWPVVARIAILNEYEQKVDAIRRDIAAAREAAKKGTT